MTNEHFKVALIGNPNCGKSTLFNVLTKSEQQVGNWPGVTVERKSGFFVINGRKIEVIDLPGVYSLNLTSARSAIDEKIAVEYFLSDSPDLIVNVVDANNLERNLFLTTQLMELDIPVVIALNKVDLAGSRKITIDSKKLEQELGCKVIELIANQNKGIDSLKITIVADQENNPCSKLVFSHPLLSPIITDLANRIVEKHKYFLAMRLFEGDLTARQHVPATTISLVVEYREKFESAEYEDIDVLVADARYGFIHDLVSTVVTKSSTKREITKTIDRVVLNRVLGIPIFLAIMYLMFLFAIKIGGYFQNIFQNWSNIVFVHNFAVILSHWHFPPWLIMIFTSGLGRGINTTVTFLPVLAAMFFFLAILENSGYVARINFVMDRVMRLIGLSGKSFVPLLVGFGCNVPAIMASRTLESEKDRILTVIMSPFMSCSARLAIYTVFTAAFFPHNGQNVVFTLYLTGILIAILTGFILRQTILQGNYSYLVTELHHYHWPGLIGSLQQTWVRLKSFLFKAGQVIIPICILLSIINSIPAKVGVPNSSILAEASKSVVPAFTPLGIEQDNWPAVTGLFAGIMAKEVVVATLNTLYTHPEAATKLTLLDSNQTISPGIYGQMYTKFNGKASAFAYLLFVLLYFPCIPTLVMIWRELNWRWALFSLSWNTGIAYGGAVIFYQIATFTVNPKCATVTIASVVAAFTIVVLAMFLIAKRTKKLGVL